MDDEPVAEGIGRVDDELFPGQEGPSLDSGDDGRVRTKRGLLLNGTGESRADDALDHDRFSDFNFVSGKMDGKPAADACTGGAAVDLSFGKDADVARMVGGVMGRADEDRSVQESEILLERTSELAGRA